MLESTELRQEASEERREEDRRVGESRIMLQSPVLVLNATYEPVNVCAARRAIILILNGVALAEEEYTGVVHSASLMMRVPSVIRLLEFRRIPFQVRALSRKNILIRDRNICQFC